MKISFFQTKKKKNNEIRKLKMEKRILSNEQNNAFEKLNGYKWLKEILYLSRIISSRCLFQLLGLFYTRTYVYISK